MSVIQSRGNRLRLSNFKIIRIKKPTTNSNWYWKDILGVTTDNPFGLTLSNNYHVVWSRNYGMRRQIKQSDVFDIIGEYKAGDIIKSRGSYIAINYLEIGEGNLWIVGEALGSGLIRRYPMTMRAFKTYTLSERIKKRLVEEKKNFLEKKKTWEADLAKMKKERASRTMTSRVINPIGMYQAVRRTKKK